MAKAINGFDLVAIRRTMENAMRATERALGDGAVEKAAIVLEKHIKQTLSQRGTGRRYPRGKKTHQASAPGEPPAVDTGQLRASIRREKAGLFTWRVGTGLEHAPHLEYGTSKMAPRPFMRPALERAIPEMTQHLERELVEKLELRSAG